MGSGEKIRVYLEIGRRIDQLDRRPDCLRLVCTWVCTNQDGTTVMTGGSQGVILQPFEAADGGTVGQ